MALRIKNLSLPGIKTFDFFLPENGLYGLIGRNGIGKSTLFSVLSGEIAISEGEILAGRVAYLPDVESFDKNLRMKDYFSVLGETAEKRALELVKIFGASEFENKKIEKFSLGMKELFATILSFSVDCDVLLIDELFSGLDVSKKALVYEELSEVAKKEIVILTLHQLKEIEHFCDKTFLLSEEGLELVNDFDSAAQVIGYTDLLF